MQHFSLRSTQKHLYLASFLEIVRSLFTMVILVQYEVSEKDAQDQGIGENTTSEEELLVVCFVLVSLII